MATARALAAAAIWFLTAVGASAQQSVSEAEKKAAYERILFGGIHFNNTERVLEALRGGADPNHARDFSDTPPLFLAVNNASRKTEIVKLLIEHGADVNARWTPGQGGRKSDADSNPMLLLLQKAPAESNRDYFPLYWAALNNNAAGVKELIVNGADVHARTGNLAMTALFATHDPAIGEMLLASGADINARDVRGQSVLSHARKRLASVDSSDARELLRPKLLSYVRWLETQGAKE